jgi:DNA polymerase-1
MARTWLLLDVSYLAHRAFHSLRDLSYKSVKTGVVFGVLRDIISFQERFGPLSRPVFCFDVGVPIRRDIFPGYKLKRHTKELTQEEDEARRERDSQVHAMRKEYLRDIGYRNIFWADRYEADDIIASITKSRTSMDEYIMVSADHDLYQLLDSNVHHFNPHTKKLTTIQSFHNEWGLWPKDYVRIKAIAGCSTDEIPGVDGVGEPTAAKWMRGELKPESKKARAIDCQAGRELALFNKPLVKLPYPGTPTFKLVDDEVTDEGFKAVAERLGLKSIASLSPGGMRSERKVSTKGFF